MRALSCLTCGCLAACFAPDVRQLPTPPEGAQTMVLALEPMNQPSQLAIRAISGPEVLAVPAEAIRQLGYYRQPAGAFGAEQLISSDYTEGCERLRKLPVANLGVHRWTGSDWVPIEDLGAELYPSFRLPAIDLEDCNRKSGCIDRDDDGLEVCKADCKPDPPTLPERAVCPQGWSEAAGTAECLPPPDASCTRDDCWLSQDPTLCTPRPPPVGAAVLTATTGLPGLIGGARVVWLRRGVHRGEITLEAGATLLGECPEATIIEGALDIVGDGVTISGLTVRQSPGTGVTVDVLPGVREANLQRVTIDGGEYGLLLQARSSVELNGVRVLNAPAPVVVGLQDVDDRRHASLRADHLWVSANGALRRTVGIEVIRSTATLRDVVVEATVIDDGVGLGIAGGSTLTLDRGFFQARRPVIVSDSAAILRDVRADGKGTGDNGVELSNVDARVVVSRVYVTRFLQTGLWARDERGAQDSAVLAHDIEVSDVRVGVTVAVTAVFEQILVERAHTTGVEMTRDGMGRVRDVTVRGSGEGLRVLLETFPLVGSAAVERARFEDNDVGVFLSEPLPDLAHVSLSRNRLGFGGDPCGANKVVGGARVHLDQNGDALESSDP